jgi:hypothetical protein
VAITKINERTNLRIVVPPSFEKLLEHFASSGERASGHCEAANVQDASLGRKQRIVKLWNVRY